jgi:hypothetical protein
MTTMLIPLAVAIAASGARVPAHISLLFFDRNGSALTPAQVRAMSTNDGTGYENDLLVDPTNLHAVAYRPFKVVGDHFEFELPPQPVALAYNWPTKPNGYSLLLLDDGGKGFSHGGTVNFTFQAAKDVKRRLDAALRQRRDYTHSAAFDEAYRDASRHLQAATTAGDEPVRGKEGQLALDSLAVAYDLLLREHGPVFARKHLKRHAPWLGFTIDTTENYKANLDRAASLAAPFGWVRVVFDRGTQPSDYKATVDYAKSKGLKVMGQPVDSSYDKHYSHKEYVEFAKRFIDAFPEIDAWEIGNEVNGGWLSQAIDVKIADVAAYCKAKGRKTVLTLFWQLNTCDPKESVFTWADANLPPEVRRNIDVVTLSIYCEQAPLGVFFDQLMTWMREHFPQQEIGIGELGYWIPDQRLWWSYDKDDPLGKAMAEVAEQDYCAALDYDRSVGGCFWWNFIKEFQDNPALPKAVADLRDSLTER